MLIPDLTPTQESRFLAKIQVGGKDDCWPWLGSLKQGIGYGQWGLNSATVLYAHRVMYKLHYGVDPGDKFVCHTCDNRPCCNPHHLWLGTHSDNMVDAACKGRIPGYSNVGQANGQSKLTDVKVRKIRKMAGTHSLRQLGSMFGVSHSTVESLLKGKTWTHVK